MATATTGNTTVVKRSGTKIAWKVLGVDGPGPSVGVIEANTLDTEGWADKICEALIDPGQLSLEVEYDGTAPTLGVWATTTIEHGTGTPEVIVSGEAAIIGFDIKHGDAKTKRTATMKLEFRGALTFGT